MDADAFERFEKSSGGLLIPVAVFVVGAIATVVAMLAVQSVARAQAAAQQELRDAEKVIPPAATEDPMDSRAKQTQILDQGPQVP